MFGILNKRGKETPRKEKDQNKGCNLKKVEKKKQNKKQSKPHQTKTQKKKQKQNTKNINKFINKEQIAIDGGYNEQREKAMKRVKGSSQRERERERKAKRERMKEKKRKIWDTGKRERER